MSSYFCQQLSAAVILLPLNTGRHIRIHNLLIKDDKYNKNRNHGNTAVESRTVQLTASAPDSVLSAS